MSSMFQRLEVRARAADSFIGNHVDLHIVTKDHKKICRELKMEPLGDGAMPVRPAPVCLEKTEAQLLMDELWTVGLRPSEGTGSAGAMAAVQNHLADLKRILFHQLKIGG